VSVTAGFVYLKRITAGSTAAKNSSHLFSSAVHNSSVIF